MAKDNLNQVSKPINKTQKNHHFKFSKKRWVRLVVLFVIVGAVFLVDAILKWRSENADITIGETVITKKQIDKTAEQAKVFKDQNPNTAVDDEFAKDTLILNAALKHYAKNSCNQKDLFGPKQVMEFSDPNITAKGDSDPIIEQNLGSSDSFYYLTQENALYKNKLQNCLIQKKEVFRVSISYETPYMDSETDAEATAKYETAKAKLQNEVLPLFEQKLPKEEIATRADMNLLVDEYASGFDFTRFEREMITVAKLDKLSEVDGTSGYNAGVIDHKGDLPNQIDLNKEVDKLKKGEYSKVLTSTAGVFTIARVENTNNAEFVNWDEFLDKIKEDNVLSYDDSLRNNQLSRYFTGEEAAALEYRGSICFALAGNTYTCQEGGSWISKPSFHMNNTVHKGDQRHLKAVRIRAWAGAIGGVPLNGVGVTGTSWGVSTSDKTEYVRYGGITASWGTNAGAFEGHGFGFALGDCNGGGIITVGITAPSGYTYSGGNFTSAIAGNNDNGIDDKNISLSLAADWSSNPRSWVYIKEDNKSEDSYNTGNIGDTGRKITAYPNQKVRFYHTSTASGTGIDYQLDLYVKWKMASGAEETTNPITRLNKTTNYDFRSYGPISETGINREQSYALWTPGYADIGKTYCQYIKMSPQSSGNSTAKTSSEVCVEVIPTPWKLSPTTKIKSNSTNKEYVAGDINVTAGETVTWEHTATNTTNYIAPGIDGSHGYDQFGYYLEYGDSAGVPGVKPTGGQAFGSSFNGNRWVHWWARTLGDIDKSKTTKNTKTVNSDTNDNIAMMSGITGLYSKNNNNKPPTSYTINATDTGKIFCQAGFVRWNEDETRGGNRTVADWRCAYVPYNYELTPCVKSGDNNCGGQIVKELGESIDLTPKINNTNKSKTKTSDWKISTWEVAGIDEKVPAPMEQIDNTSSDSCGTYNSAFGGKIAKNTCVIKHQGSSTFDNPENILQDVINHFTVPETAELGKRYCFALSVNNYTFNDEENQTTQNNKSSMWRHGVPLCVLVAKKPKMQVWGGNVWSTHGVRTSTTNIGGRYFGSWAEYDLISAGQVFGMASASGYSPVQGANGAAAKQIARLTPRASDNILGTYSATIPESNLLANLSARFKRDDAQKQWNVDAIEATSRPTLFNFGDKNETIHQTTLNKGQSAILFTKGKIIIDGNITMNTTGADTPLNTPQLVIVAEKGIEITSNVTNIDAWLITTGEVKTCNVAKTAVNQISCGNSLRVNGPIIAGKLRSWRTAGSLPDRTVPAETYNLRPDTYQWLHAQASGYNRIFSEYTKELPPRF